MRYVSVGEAAMHQFACTAAAYGRRLPSVSNACFCPNRLRGVQERTVQSWYRFKLGADGKRMYKECVADDIRDKKLLATLDNRAIVQDSQVWHPRCYHVHLTQGTTAPAEIGGTLIFRSR